jgi:hypothetical protein
VKPGIETFIHFGDHIGDLAHPAFEQAQNLAFSLFAVTHHAAREPLGIFDRRAVRGVVDSIIAVD